MISSSLKNSFSVTGIFVLFCETNFMYHRRVKSGKIFEKAVLAEKSGAKFECKHIIRSVSLCLSAYVYTLNHVHAQIYPLQRS
jgi:hypothetical protein